MSSLLIAKWFLIAPLFNAALRLVWWAIYSGSKTYDFRAFLRNIFSSVPSIIKFVLVFLDGGSSRKRFRECLVHSLVLTHFFYWTVASYKSVAEKLFTKGLAKVWICDRCDRLLRNQGMPQLWQSNKQCLTELPHLWQSLADCGHEQNMPLKVVSASIVPMVNTHTHKCYMLLHP